MRFYFSIVARIVPVIALGASCALPSMDVTPRYISMSIDGDFGASATSINTTASLAKAGLDDAEGVLGLRADLTWGMPHIIVSTQSSSFRGDGVADATLMFDGMTISSGSPVETEVDMDVHSAVIVFDVFPSDIAEIAIGLGLSAIDYNMRVTDTLSLQSIHVDESLPLPVIAVNLGVQLGPIEVAALLSGFSINYSDFDGSYFDADIFARYSMAGGKNRVRASIVLGWRQTALDVEYVDSSNEVEAVIDLSGPYLGVEFTL